MSTEQEQVRRPVKIKTRRGSFSVDARGRLHGLWPLVQREALTNEQVRQLAGGKRKPVPRSLLIYWRSHNAFPAPVLRFPARGGEVEVWSRSEVEDWLKARERRRVFVETGQSVPLD